MTGILTVFMVALLFICSPARGADWDPFSFMNKDSQNIIMPTAASQSTGLQDLQQGNDWPPAQTREWQENKDTYTISIPVRLPDDADTQALTYKYSDGTLKINAPKKKLKSFI